MLHDPVLWNDWHPVASIYQLREQRILATRLLGEDLVIWQADHQIQVWRDLCIHRGAKLSGGHLATAPAAESNTAPESGSSTAAATCLVCPYHGWRYDSTGHCVQIPAHPKQAPPQKARATSYPVQVRYGLVWTSLGEPTTDLPPFPEWEQPGFVTAPCGPFDRVRAHGPRIIENFLDATHFAFVHAGVLGDPAHAAIGEYEVEIRDDGVFSEPIAVYQPNPFGDRAGTVQYIYSAFRPLTAHFTKKSPNATNGLLLVVTPHDELDCTAWFVVATTTAEDSEQLRIDYTPRIGAIFEEDRAIIESQRPELLPLDLQAELHLRSDRMAIGYRTWLRQLGLRYGTA